MPLRPDSKKKLNTSGEVRGRNGSFDSCYDTMDDAETDKNCPVDEEDPEEFLSQMGLETEEIKRINNAQVSLFLVIIYLMTVCLWSSFRQMLKKKAKIRVFGSLVSRCGLTYSYTSDFAEHFQQNFRIFGRLSIVTDTHKLTD